MRLHYRNRETAEAVRDAMRYTIAPVFSVPYKPDADGFYYIEVDNGLIEAVQLTAMAYPRLATRDQLVAGIRNIIRRDE